MANDRQAAALLAAFPPEVREDALAAVEVMPPDKTWETVGSVGEFRIQLEGETVTIPERIYNAEPKGVRWLRVRRLTPNQTDALHCIYTRHHNGYLRQRHLSHILGRPHHWVVPFIVRLVGEYVLPTLEDIRAGLADLDVAGSALNERFARFAAENPDFIRLTRSRVVSYWNVYYRDEYPVFSDYPGSALMSALESGRVPAE